MVESRQCERNGAGFACGTEEFQQKTSAKVITLSDEDENVINEIGTNEGAKHNIVPTETNLKIGGDFIDYKLDKNSVTVFVLD